MGEKSGAPKASGTQAERASERGQFAEGDEARPHGSAFIFNVLDILIIFIHIHRRAVLPRFYELPPPRPLRNHCTQYPDPTRFGRKTRGFRWRRMVGDAVCVGTPAVAFPLYRISFKRARAPSRTHTEMNSFSRLIIVVVAVINIFARRL